MTKEEKPVVKTKLDAMCELLELKERNKMLKDEMKNRISLALKDPILQQGFEIICKENAELKKKISFLEDNLRVARKDREVLQLDIARGLKEFVKDSPATALRYLANEKYVEQLIKAKEIIRELLDTQSRLDPYRDLFKARVLKAEQFLNEVEK